MPCRLLQCVEIEVLATGCQPFSCPCSRNVTNCWKEICSTCLSKESMPCVKSKCPLRTRSCPWERQHTLPALHYGCIMPIPSLQLQKKPVSGREAEGLVTELWSRGLVEEYSDLRWFHVTTAKEWIVLEIELSNHRRLEMCLPAFQLPMFAKCDCCTCQEEMYFICLFRLYKKSEPSLPTSSLMFLRAGFLQFTTTCASWRQLCSKRAAVSTIVTKYHFRPSHPVNRR